MKVGRRVAGQPLPVSAVYLTLAIWRGLHWFERRRLFQNSAKESKDRGAVKEMMLNRRRNGIATVEIFASDYLWFSLRIPPKAILFL
jgi:hypothetical protein